MVTIISFLLYNSSLRSYSLSKIFQLFILQRLINIEEDMAIFYYFCYLNGIPKKKKKVIPPELEKESLFCTWEIC